MDGIFGDTPHHSTFGRPATPTETNVVWSQGFRSLITSTGFCQQRKRNVTRSRLPVSEAITLACWQKLTMNQTSLSNGDSREAGIVQVVGPYDGIIKCVDQEGYLFFRIGQFLGDKDDLKANDLVEFDVQLDALWRRDEALHIERLGKLSDAGEWISEEDYLGEIINSVEQTASKSFPSSYETDTDSKTVFNTSELRSDVKQGGVRYKNRAGIMDVLPYFPSDIASKDVQLCARNQVSFRVVYDKNTNELRATNITLIKYEKYTGIVSAMKESYGFIERADIVEEIFFHHSEIKTTSAEQLTRGDAVEFYIQIRNDRFCATDVYLLPAGSVVLEECYDEVYTGIVEVPLPPKVANRPPRSEIDSVDAAIQMSRRAKVLPLQSSAILAGVIQRRMNKIRFGERHRAANCSYTLRHGDRVSFRIVADKRTLYERAIKVTLDLNETLKFSNEKREWGLVVAVRSDFGFIRCADRGRLFFHFSEMLDSSHFVKISDEVEFTVDKDIITGNERLHATRIKVLAKGTVHIPHKITSCTTNAGVANLQSDSPAPAKVGMITANDSPEGKSYPNIM